MKRILLAAAAAAFALSAPASAQSLADLAKQVQQEAEAAGVNTQSLQNSQLSPALQDQVGQLLGGMGAAGGVQPTLDMQGLANMAQTIDPQTLQAAQNLLLSALRQSDPEAFRNLQAMQQQQGGQMGLNIRPADLQRLQVLLQHSGQLGGMAGSGDILGGLQGLSSRDLGSLASQMLRAQNTQGVLGAQGVLGSQGVLNGQGLPADLGGMLGGDNAAVLQGLIRSQQMGQTLGNSRALDSLGIDGSRVGGIVSGLGALNTLRNSPQGQQLGQQLGQQQGAPSPTPSLADLARQVADEDE